MDENKISVSHGLEHRRENGIAIRVNRGFPRYARIVPYAMKRSPYLVALRAPVPHGNSKDTDGIVA